MSLRDHADTALVGGMSTGLFGLWESFDVAMDTHPFLKWAAATIGAMVLNELKNEIVRRLQRRKLLLSDTPVDVTPDHPTTPRTAHHPHRGRFPSSNTEK